MAKVTVRMWTKDGYHKDVATIIENQAISYLCGMEKRIGPLTPPFDAGRISVIPAEFPEAIGFEVIVER